MSHEQGSDNLPSRGKRLTSQSSSIQETKESPRGGQYEQRPNEGGLAKRGRLMKCLDTSDELSSSQEDSDGIRKSRRPANENKDGDFANFCITLDKLVPNGPKGKQEILKILWSLYQSHTGRKG